MSESWKALERLAASALGGQRHIRWDLRESGPDVDLPAGSPFTVECKYRKRLPVLLLEGLLQAARYGPGRVPLLVIKEHGQVGALAVMRLEDLRALLARVEAQP